MTISGQLPVKYASSFSYIPGESNSVSMGKVVGVLAGVFKYINFKTLREIRLVCRSWNEIVCNATGFGDLCEVVIRDDPDEALYYLNARPEFKPWKHFTFITSKLDNSSHLQTQFWISVGFNLSSLHLISHSLAPLELLAVLGACPKLKSLTLSCKNIYECHLWGNRSGDVAPQKTLQAIRFVDDVRFMRDQNFLGELKILKILDSNLLPQGVLRDLLVLAHRVEALTLYDNSTSTIPSWDVGDVVRFAAVSPTVIKRLELSGSNIYPEYVGALANIAGLKLNSLHLRYAKLTDSSLLSLLKQQKRLIELDLSYSRFSDRAFNHLQCSFVRLKRLILRGFSSNVTSFGFLRRMPKLEELDLSASFSNSINWELLIGCLLPMRLKKLKSLNVSFNLALGTFPRARLFTSFMEAFTHITCINLSLNNFMKDSYVHEIWRHMKHLRVVFLENLNGMSTEGITGIRLSQYQNFLANGTLDKVNPEKLRLHNSNGSYIGLCPGIQILSLAGNPRLNDIIIQFGLIYLHNLQKLKLAGCNKITEKYFADLIQSCPRLDYLDISGTQITKKRGEWAKKSNPNIRRLIVSDNVARIAKVFGPTPGIHGPPLPPKFQSTCEIIGDHKGLERKWSIADNKLPGFSGDHQMECPDRTQIHNYHVQLPKNRI